MKKKVWGIIIAIGVIVLITIVILGVKLFISAEEAFDEAFVINGDDLRIRRI